MSQVRSLVVFLFGDILFFTLPYVGHADWSLDRVVYSFGLGAVHARGQLKRHRAIAFGVGLLPRNSFKTLLRSIVPRLASAVHACWPELAATEP